MNDGIKKIKVIDVASLNVVGRKSENIFRKGGRKWDFLMGL